MKKRYKYFSKILIISLLLVGSGCTKILDKVPNNILTNDLIVSDISAYTSHIAYLYSQMPFENFHKNIWLSYYTGEMVNCQQDQNNSLEYTFGNWGTTNPTVTPWANNYKLIRALNNMIELNPKATCFGTEADKTAALGELRFMRAYIYFTLVQRYGGVPLVTATAQLPASGDITELSQARDKAETIYSFVKKEMDESIAQMSGTLNLYRFNKWSALAFESRAMLYAASVAKYETVQFDGLIGIPASQATSYFTAASDAALQVIQSGNYALYNASANKVTNYHQLFMDESSANKERIMVDAYMYPVSGHNFELLTAPFSHRGGEGYGGRFDPTYSMIEEYEYVNDRNGALKIADGSGNPIKYTKPADLFTGKDPRFFASVAYPGCPWGTDTLQIWGNTLSGGVLQGSGGKDGLLMTECSSTGFYLIKWFDLKFSRPITGSSSDVDKQMIRYAEVLLNYAEAQMELSISNEPVARPYINLIRDRAGIQTLTGPITLADIRHERKVELAYEGNYYWDLKRWRTFSTLFLNTPSYGLYPVKDLDNKCFEFYKQPLQADKFTLTFDPRAYYVVIDAGAISANKLLLQNPGY